METRPTASSTVPRTPRNRERRLAATPRNRERRLAATPRNLERAARLGLETWSAALRHASKPRTAFPQLATHYTRAATNLRRGRLHPRGRPCWIRATNCRI